jgi:hypothetical protein
MQPYFSPCPRPVARASFSDATAPLARHWLGAITVDRTAVKEHMATTTRAIRVTRFFYWPAEPMHVAIPRAFTWSGSPSESARRPPPISLGEYAAAVVRALVLCYRPELHAVAQSHLSGHAPVPASVQPGSRAAWMAVAAYPRSQQGLVSPLCGARLPASEPGHAHRVSPLQ